MKVYELAKELGTDSISLLDKLKELSIVVKNHMSSLDEVQVTKAKEALGKKSKSAKSTAKKKVVRKRKAAGTDSKAASSAPVIRRRQKADAPAAKEAAEPAKAPAAVVKKKTTAAKAAETPEAKEKAEAAPPQAETPAEAPKAKVDKKTAEVAEKKEAKLKPKEAKKRFEPKSFLKIVETPKPKDKPKAPKQAKATSAEPPMTPEEIAQKAEQAKQRGKGAGRIISMGKEALDRMAEEEAAKKRGATTRENRPTRPEDARFADYRKKEVIFLPRRKKVPVGKEMHKTQITTPKARKRVIDVSGTISVGKLAEAMGIKASEIIRKLMGMGQMATVNQTVDPDTASLIAAEFKYEINNVTFKEEHVIQKAEDKPEDLQGRPPVVTVMGHVDHGKTSLLDAIRETDVVKGEAGGITQHIGAYTITAKGQKITFIDTPGHEAFSLMRSRGANVTDIVILVVAADDGVMPQTREAVSHAKAAEVPIIVAVNKMDKPGANPEKAKQGLSELGLLSEDWGGETQFVEVSAMKKTGLDKLLECISLQAELLELKSNPEAPASGQVLEARLEKGRGPVVSVLVTRGTLKVGESLVAGEQIGRVRAMMDERGQRVNEVPPGTAAEVLGFEKVPNAGDSFDITASDADARKLIAHRKAQGSDAPKTSKMSLDDLFAKIESGNVKELPVVVKADVFGSVEAIRDSLSKLSTDKARVNVIHTGTGGVTESDVLLASASNAIILGFNVRPETKARQVAEKEKVQIQTYKVIYELIDEVKKAMTGLLDKKEVEKFLGRAEVRQTFSIPKAGVIAGTAVIDGKVTRGARVRLLRDSKIIFEGKMTSLKRFKEDAKEVANGYECGIGLENFNDIKSGDIIEAFEIEHVAQEL